MAESSLAVADYLLGQHSNFLQFAGQKDGATRCAQIVQLLLANHVDHDVSDPLVAVQRLDAPNAFCSVSRQPQFDVLSGKASFPYDDARVQVGDKLPRPRTLDKYWGYFCLCRAMPPLCVSVTIRGSLIITCPAPRGGSRVMI